MSTRSTLEQLDQLFPSAILIPVVDAGRVIGFAKSTVHNKLSAGKFPISVQKNGGLCFVRKSDLAAFIDRDSLPAAKRRGRPRKVAAAEVAA